MQTTEKYQEQCPLSRTARTQPTAKVLGASEMAPFRHKGLLAHPYLPRWKIQGEGFCTPIHVPPHSCALCSPRTRYGGVWCLLLPISISTLPPFIYASLPPSLSITFVWVSHKATWTSNGGCNFRHKASFYIRSPRTKEFSAFIRSAMASSRTSKLSAPIASELGSCGT